MDVRIIDSNFDNNGGDGVRILGAVNLEMHRSQARGNRGQGLNVITPSLVAQLGLPDDTDPHELAALLHTLQSAAPESRHETVQSSSLFRKICGAAVDSTTLLNNILGIVNNPQVLEIIKRLSS